MRLNPEYRTMMKTGKHYEQNLYRRQRQSADVFAVCFSLACLIVLVAVLISR